MQTLENTSQLPTLPLTVRRKMVGFSERLAERVVEAREQKGWSRRELAFRAQISDKTLERLEGGEIAKPRGTTLQKIAEAVGTEVADLRPDMEREEKNLRSQLDRIEAGVRENADAIDAMAAQLALLLGALDPAERSAATTRKSATSAKKRAAG